MLKEKPLSLKLPVEIIRSIGSIGWGIFTSGPLNGVKARMRKSGKQFLINWTNPYLSETIHQEKQGHHDLSFEFKGHALILEQIFDETDMLLRHRGVKITEHVNFFHTSGFEKNEDYYHRLVIPLEQKMNFLFQLARKPFADDFGRGYAQGTKAVINGEELRISLFHDNKKQAYMSIDSSELQSYEVFSDKAHAIINALGFVTGYLAGDTGWYFLYADKDLTTPVHFYHNPLRNAIHTSYTPVNTNPHTWIRNKIEADRLYDLKFLKPISFDVFSNLCQKLYESVDFSSAVLLILEASTASLIFRPGGYAIALETLADLVIGEEKAKAPMDKPLSKIVREALNAVIEKECEHLPDENREILLGKIKQINQVTNKSRLRIPFDELGLKLNEKDLELIATRKMTSCMDAFPT